MPARKSNVSIGEPADEVTPAPRDGLSVEDLSLPRTMVQRLAKGVLPPNTQIQKDALLAMSKSATVFVNYLTSHANDNAVRANKKTIQPKDVLEAVRDLEFENFLPRLEIELQKYNAIQCDKRNSYRRKVREEKAAAAAKADPASGDGDLSTADAALLSPNGHSKRGEDDSEPAAKKVRRDHLNGETESADEEEDGDIEDQGEGEGEEEQEEDEAEEDEDEEEGPEDQLVEDPLEEREGVEEGEEDEEGDESD